MIFATGFAFFFISLLWATFTRDRHHPFDWAFAILLFLGIFTMLLSLGIFLAGRLP